MHTPFSPLLPLQGMSITLRFLANAEFSYFHQMTVDAFTRYLLDSPKDYQTSITSEAPESGRLFYKPDDTYRFSVLTFAGQNAPFTPLLRMLHDLPNAAPIKSPNAPLRDNIKLDSIIDLIDGQAISNSSGMRHVNSSISATVGRTIKPPIHAISPCNGLALYAYCVAAMHAHRKNSKVKQNSVVIKPNSRPVY